MEWEDYATNLSCSIMDIRSRDFQHAVSSIWNLCFEVMACGHWGEAVSAFAMDVA